MAARLQRLRAQVSRVRSRVSAYRQAAEEEVARREREHERRVVGDDEPSLHHGSPDGDAPARARLAQSVSVSARSPLAAGETAPRRPGDDRAAVEPAAGDGGDGGRGGPGGARPGPPPPAEALPWGLRVASEVCWRLLVMAAVVWVLIQVVGAISLLVISFAAGLLVTALLQPFTGRLKQIGLGRGAATAVTSFTGFGVIGLVGWFVVWQVMENIDNLVESVTDGINELRDWAVDGPFAVSEDDLTEMVDNVNRWLSDHSAELTSAGLEGANYLFRFLSGAGVALFVVLFLLYDGRNIWYWCLKFLPASARPGVAGAGPRAWITLTGYVRGTVLVAAIDAVGIGLGLYFLNVPMAVPLAVIVFLFAFIPIVGAFVSGALAVVVAFVTDGPITALLVVALVLVVQQIEGQILQPLILGRLVRVHPLGVVLAVTAGTLLAGIPGAVVAVPLVAVLNTVVGYLRAYHREAEMRADPRTSGATVAALAPTPPPYTMEKDEAPSSGGTSDRPPHEADGGDPPTGGPGGASPDDPPGRRPDDRA
ncbi:AI-2E family transporter [Streptomyces spiramenti]|uniref:AI-2E family transporter n=1 Tax=Streptomyces spiramenti TaxID=2720606 RepID=A0ABX1AQM3_9ACTN|nr:AI-2E family transporter [Streptomyces spiramenti]NJP67723.1 AI-2E family transporter [Streptomyces spiramenti]